jgi:hypothetical protein
VNDRERRVRRLEALYDVGAPTGCCCAPPSAEAYRDVLDERQRMSREHPEMTQREIVAACQPTCCARNGGPLCADAVAYFDVVRERVGRLEQTFAGLAESEL